MRRSLSISSGLTPANSRTLARLAAKPSGRHPFAGRCRDRRDLGIYVADLKMSANGSLGGALAFLESGSRLQLGGLSDELTLAMWVKWRGPHAHADRRHGLVSTMPAKKDAGWAFSILEDGRLQFNWVNEKGGSFRTSSASLAENQWTHVAMRWQGGEKSGGLEFFINGEPVGVNQKWTGGGPIKKSGLNLILGVMDEAAYLPLNGSLAEVNLFGKALSDEDVRALAQAPRQSALPKRLLARWRRLYVRRAWSLLTTWWLCPRREETPASRIIKRRFNRRRLWV